MPTLYKINAGIKILFLKTAGFTPKPEITYGNA